LIRKRTRVRAHSRAQPPQHDQHLHRSLESSIMLSLSGFAQQLLVRSDFHLILFLSWHLARPFR
jgi:hypothetical protein